MLARGKEAAALGLHRFGFGASGDSIAAISGDPRGALLADLDRSGTTAIAAGLPTSTEAARAVSEFRAEQQAKQKLALRVQKASETGGDARAMNRGDGGFYQIRDR